MVQYLPAAAEHTENAAVISAATAAAEITVLDYQIEDLPDLVGVSSPEGRHYTVLDLEQYADRPRTKQAASTVEDPESFSAYVVAHKTPGTTLWANRRAGTVLGMLDDHEPEPDTAEGRPGWGRHHITLRMTVTEDWQHWTKLDGQFKGQAILAEHLDDGAASIVEPPAADMIALAQTFSAKRDVAFRSATRLQSGDVGLTYEETTTAKAGQKGTIEIPDTILLRLAPWEGCPEYDVSARFRYRINDGILTLGYRMIRPDRVLRDAFGGVLSQIREATGLVAYLGTR